MRVDIECEETIIDYMQKLKLPVRIISEEHGTIDVTNNPRYLAVLDGLDGSGVYKKQRGTGRYGTMFAIFRGIDPCYNDYIAGGIMEHSIKRMFFYAKGEGACVMDIESGTIVPIKSSDKKVLDQDTKIYVDEYFEINRKTFLEKLSGFLTSYLKSSAVYYADAAAGKADLVLECTRKLNLEIAVAYGLIAEVGGVMVDLQGNDLGPQRYLEFGQKENLPIITACTPEMAQSLLKHLNNF